ncbi:redoxin domain-containing protein [Nucisporomicrobium flavum]|jgi:peroxiredoxin|uniref:redoxin domain-containing protein n=1 Tax=Nucisporomicrobium flavum TaxID=2785915 RepID=UPI003C2CF0AE
MPSTVAVPDVGTRMPDLALVSPEGDRTSLHTVRGDERAIAYFLRSDTCPICLRHARSLADLAEAGDLGGARVILIVPGNVAEAREVATKVPPAAVTIWASGAGHAAAGLGTFLSVQHSGTFLIAPDGSVAYRRTSALPPRSMDRAELLEAIAR